MTTVLMIYFLGFPIAMFFTLMNEKFNFSERLAVIVTWPIVFFMVIVWSSASAMSKVLK